MNTKRAAAYVFLLAVVLAVPVASQAQLCLKYRHTTYYGYDHGSGPRCNAVVYPPGNPIVVGERIRHCDGTVEQWGLVCFDVPPDVYTEDCQDCERDPDGFAANGEAVEGKAESDKTAAADAGCPVE